MAGEDSGPKKLVQAEEMNIPVLSEDDLLDLIREKSGIKPLKAKTETKVKEEKKSPIKQATKSPAKSDDRKHETKTDSNRAKNESPKKLSDPKHIDESGKHSLLNHLIF